MTKPLSERIDDMRQTGMHGAKMFNLLDECYALARRVEGAEVVEVIDGGMMIQPFRQYGRLSVPDDGENPSTKEARFLGQFVGQRVRLVPEVE